MNSIRNIGVYLPLPVADDPAARRGELLAEVTGARLTLLVPRDHVNRLEIARLVSTLEARSKVVALETGAAAEVRQAVESHDIDIVLKTARPMPGSHRVVGGVAQELLRDCPCPLWVVRRTVERVESPVIAAVGYLSSSQNVPEAQRVIQTAAHIARCEGRPLVVAHAWSPLERALGQLGRTDRRLYLFEHRRWMLEKLSRVVEHATSMPAELELLEGEPSEVLPELAARLSSDTIVVGHRRRRGLSAFLFGNTGENLIENTWTSVLSVHAA